jgi:NADP-dependent 3-hydroxy acid dehydrogenase YdfG
MSMDHTGSDPASGPSTGRPTDRSAHRRTAVVTGASSGIGAATCRRLVAEGFAVVGGARRQDRLGDLERELGDAFTARPLDVTATASVDAFCAAIEHCHVLVNNAGGALGLDAVADADEEQWRTMLDTNVLGVMRMTRALLPKLVASGEGHVLTVGSVAGFEPYKGGAGYNAAKYGARAVTEVLRLELLGQPVRITEVDPGMVRTDFSTVRFGGDTERAAAVYQGMTPLEADDIADCIVWAISRPAHVNIDQIVVRPRDQARVGLVHRRPDSR